MTAAWAIYILLGLGVASAVFSAAGILLAGDVYERLHFMAPVASVGVVSIAAAVVVQESLSQAGIKAILVALIVFVMNPILTHATARAARTHELGQWMPKPEEHIEVVGAGPESGRQ